MVSVGVYSAHLQVARQPCPSMVHSTGAEKLRYMKPQSEIKTYFYCSVAAAVTQKLLKTAAQSLDLKLPTGGTDPIAFANISQGSLPTVKQILLLLFSNRA